MEARPFIEFKNVELEYPGHVHALRGINLTVQKGEFVFLVGKTGAGKSTLLKLLTRELKATSGQILVDEEDTTQIPGRKVHLLRREMGIVPQDFALLPRKRVWENVAYAMRAVGKSRRDVRRTVPAVLEQVMVAHRADAYPTELSGGEQQRVAIARALINHPPLLIADEPTGNLDHEHSWEIMEVLKQLNLGGTTILVASHDTMVVERMSTRIVTLDHGQIVGDTGSAQRTLLDVEVGPDA